jgi:putative CocE/NonD family hydrolase
MLIGPWVHGVNGPAGDLDPGPAGRVDLNALAVRWFDHWLRGVDNSVDRDPPVKVFALGRNEWRDYPDWPPPGAHPHRLFLTPAPSGDVHAGGLAAAKPRAKATTRFRYDPADPAPTTGGPTFVVPAGQKDQRLVEARPDVALFTSLPLKQDVEIAGEVTARLFVRSSEPDTDFTAKLVAVQPDGRAVNLLDGIRRLRTYHSYERLRTVTPGRGVSLEVDLGATDAVFRAGSRIRLEVSSSNFPRFDRNPNTGAPFGTETTLRPADNEVLHGGETSSTLTLPVRAGRL